jgi:hypothetical protein
MFSHLLKNFYCTFSLWPAVKLFLLSDPQQSVENSTSIQLHVPDTGHREYNGHHLMELLNVPQPQRHEANMSVNSAANSGCATTSNVSLQEMHYHMEQQQPTFSQFIQVRCY